MANSLEVSEQFSLEIKVDEDTNAAEFFALVSRVLEGLEAFHITGGHFKDFVHGRNEGDPLHLVLFCKRPSRNLLAEQEIKNAHSFDHKH